MKLIRWLFSNIILIMFVLALTYAYVYWDNLTGEDTPAGRLIAYLSTEYDEVREFLDDYDLTVEDTTEVVETEPARDVTETATVPQVAIQPRQQAQAPQPAVPTQPTLQVPSGSPVRPVYPERQTQAMRQPGGQPYPGQAMTQPARPYPDQAMMQQARPYPDQAMMQQARPYPDQAMMQQARPFPDQAMMQPARPYPDQAMMQQPQPMPEMLSTPGGREPMAGSRSAEPMPSPGEQAVSAAEPVSTTRELWISAREEYHRGNIDVAIRSYKEVIASSPDNFDAYGELGNVYFSSGNRKEAANAYFEAAAILVKLGRVGRARSLLPMLGRLDRARAEELNQLIKGATG